MWQVASGEGVWLLPAFSMPQLYKFMSCPSINYTRKFRVSPMPEKLVAHFDCRSRLVIVVVATFVAAVAGNKNVGRAMQILTSSCHKQQPNERCNNSNSHVCLSLPLPKPRVLPCCPLLCHSEIVQLHQARQAKMEAQLNALSECATSVVCVCQVCCQPRRFLTWLPLPLLLLLWHVWLAFVPFLQHKTKRPRGQHRRERETEKMRDPSTSVELQSIGKGAACRVE